MIILQNIKQNLPPGLETEEVEFYLHNGLKCLYNGVRYSWGEFPQWILDLVEQDMLENPDALPGLIAMDCHTPEEQFTKYIVCRFGGFDIKPDITTDRKIIHTEYFECGRRGNCAQEGKVCAAIKVGEEHLTKQEINILKKVAVGKSNKVIAAELFISEETVSTHNQNIQRKLKVDNKWGMANWAFKRNISEPK